VTVGRFYHLENHREPEQLAEMRRLEREGTCLFCSDQLESETGEQHVVHRTRHWFITPNRFPYAGAKLHYLLVPEKHVTDVLDLPAADREDFWTALAWVRDEHELSFYGLGARCGDCEYTGGTIRHVHVHVIVGDVDDPEHRPVRFKLSTPAKPG
jgi:ATP adenylyltransferase